MATRPLRRLGAHEENAKRTLLIDAAERPRVARVMHALRRAASRIAADCERMLASQPLSERRPWRMAVGDALIASRELLMMASQPITETDPAAAAQALTSLATRVREPQQRILDNMLTLLQHTAATPDEEMLLEDARGVRAMVTDLFAIDDVERGRAAIASTMATAESKKAASPEARSRILVAEDDPAIRALLERILSRLYDVVPVDNGKKALELAGLGGIDLILTDMNMPELTGTALLKELKADPRTCDIPVIVISGQGDLSSVVTCIEEGAEEHITKPFQPVLLQVRVRASLDRKRMRDVEREYIRRVAQLTAAAEAVERDSYTSGSLDSLASESDELGRLARVFDRVVSGLQSREERLKRRLQTLRSEMSQATGSHTVIPSEPSSDESPFHSGETLASRYVIIGTLGKGGMGMVYHARDQQLGDEVAIKVVRPEIVKANPTIVERLKSEIRLSRKISHRNVVRAHDLGEWNGTYFITMEYVKGISIEELLGRRGRLSVDAALAIGTQLAEALAVAHEQQIIHRDVKPGNLLVDGEGVLKVMDFGIARSLTNDERLTLGGFIVGTPHYMAPEQLMGRHVDERADLYAAGAVLYECLAGRPPYLAETAQALVSDIAERNMVPLSQIITIPPSFEAIVNQLLEFEASARIRSARDLAGKLAETEHLVGETPSKSLLDEIDLEIVLSRLPGTTA